MENKKNYLLFMPSLMRDNAQPITYRAENWETRYEGKQTNEALTKYLCHRLSREGEKLEKIFMLCTPEVLNRPVEAAEGKTSSAYYCSQVGDFAISACGYTKEEAEAMFFTIPYTPVLNTSHDDVTEAIRQVIAYITEHGKEDDCRLYVDFTGGTRNAAMALVFACRIAERQGVHVERIFYSNISAGEGIIEDCTGTYDAFKQMEAVVRLDLGDYDGAQQMNAFTGKKREVFAENVEQMKEIKEKESLNDFKGAQEAARKAKQAAEKNLASGIGGLLGQQAKKTDQAAQKRLEKDVIPELEAIRRGIGKTAQMKQKLDAIAKFREKAVYILWKAEILEVGSRYQDKKQKKDGRPASIIQQKAPAEILAAYQYYVGNKQPKNHFHGAWEAANDLIQAFAGEADAEPREVYEQWKEEQERQIEECFDNLKKGKDMYPYYYQFLNSFAHNEWSRDRTRPAVLEFVKEEGLDKGSLEDNVKAYDRADRLFMHYGFPYFCTYDKEMFSGYDEAYKKELDKLARRVQGLYMARGTQGMDRRKPDPAFEKVLREVFNVEIGEPYEAAIAKIAEVCAKGPVPAIFPFVLDRGRFPAERERKEDWSQKMFAFAGSLDMIRQIRNKIAHPKTMSREEVERVTDMVRESIAWIDEERKKPGGQERPLS